MSLIGSPLNYPRQEHLPPGHMACPGCGMAIALRSVLKVLGEDTILLFPPGCTSVVLNMKMRRMATPFGTAAATAAGVKLARELRGDSKATVLVWAGDGATFDAGLGVLSACAERNDDIIYVCYDNEAYMNTGNQRSSATPWGVTTYTTPAPLGNGKEKKNVVEIMATHRVPYAATASIGFIDDLMAKIAKAKAIKGFRFIHLFSPCPTGWGSESDCSVELARLAVETRVFPILEIENGESYTINVNPRRVGIEKYTQLQDRYRNLSPEDLQQLQKAIDHRWRLLLRRSKLTIAARR